MSVTVDTSELDGFAQKLAQAPVAVAAISKASLLKEAVNVKQEWRFSALTSPSFRGIEPSIRFDVTEGDGWVEASIYPDKHARPAAKLSNIAIYGGSKGGGGTVISPEELAEHAQESMTTWAAKLAKEVL